VWHWKYYKVLWCHCENPWNAARNFWHFTQMLKVSDPIQTNSKDRLWTPPNHLTMRKSWLFLSWLVGQFEFDLFPYVWKKAALCQEPSESLAYYCAYVLTTITLEKIWLSSKFHPVLCEDHKFLKINFVSCEIQKPIFLWRQQSCIRFHGGSAIG